MINAGLGYIYQSVGVSGRANHLKVYYISNWTNQSVMVQRPLSPATHCDCRHWCQLCSIHDRRTSQTVCWV